MHALEEAAPAGGSADSTSDWHLWCRLCAKEDAQGNVNVYCKDEQSASLGNGSVGSSATEFNLTAAIEKYFWVQISREDTLPKMLCTECYSLVTALVNFAERISKVQKMFATLQSAAEMSGLDLHALRLKYGLLDEEREHVLVQQPVAEVHYFKAKLKTNELEEKVMEVKPALTPTLAGPFENSLENLTAAPTSTDFNIQIKKEHTTKDFSSRQELEEESFEELDNVVAEFEEEEQAGEVDPFNCDPVTTADAVETNDCKTHEVCGDENTSQPAQEAIEDQEIDGAALQESQNSERTRKRQKRLRQRSTAAARKNERREEEQDIRCKECGRKFKYMYYFRQHMKRTHAKEVAVPELKCPTCSQAFSTQYKLQKHMKVHIPLDQRKVLPCRYCDKKFTTHKFLQTHVKYIHMNERSFICEECGVAVHTNAALKDHMLTHTDYAPFVCEICKKGFKNQTRLKNHMEIHDPNKHICAKCGLQLNSRPTLNRHLLVHSDEMQHKCDYCGRAFKRAKALKNHLILHTGLKPYSCDFCDRTFANGSNCRSHKKKAHPEELAALEAAGGGRTYTRNIPKLEALKAITKATDNLAPVVSKQSGCFAFGKKSKSLAGENTKICTKATQKSTIASITDASEPTTTTTAAAAHIDLSSIPLMDSNEHVVGPTPGIPNFNNIYNHIMKQTSVLAHETPSDVNPRITEAVSSADGSLNVKRPLSQAPTVCGLTGIEQPAHPQNIHLQQQPTTQSSPTTTQHFYEQLQHQPQPQQQQQSLHALLAQPQQSQHHDELAASMRSPESQSSSTNLINDDRSNGSVNAHFFNRIRQSLQPGTFI